MLHFASTPIAMVTTYTQGFPVEYPSLLWLWKYLGRWNLHFPPFQNLDFWYLTGFSLQLPQKKKIKKLHIVRSPPENLG